MTEPWQSTVGNNIRRVRESRGLSRQALAELVGTAERYIYFIESARLDKGRPRSPSVEMLARMAFAMKVDIAEFFKGIKRNQFEQ